MNPSVFWSGDESQHQCEKEPLIWWTASGSDLLEGYFWGEVLQPATRGSDHDIVKCFHQQLQFATFRELVDQRHETTTRRESWNFFNALIFCFYRHIFRKLNLGLEHSMWHHFPPSVWAQKRDGDNAWLTLVLCLISQLAICSSVSWAQPELSPWKHRLLDLIELMCDLLVVM